MPAVGLGVVLVAGPWARDSNPGPYVRRQVHDICLYRHWFFDMAASAIIEVPTGCSVEVTPMLCCEPPPE